MVPVLSRGFFPEHQAAPGTKESLCSLLDRKGELGRSSELPVQWFSCILCSELLHASAHQAPHGLLKPKDSQENRTEQPFSPKPCPVPLTPCLEAC